MIRLSPHIAIACGGTGGHLFPGVAVAKALLARGCEVTLLTSDKEVDRKAVSGVSVSRIIALPGLPSTAGKIAFVRSMMASYSTARRLFLRNPPGAVLGMGGFATAGPILAGRRGGALTFLHEANAHPGRANRWFSRMTTMVFTAYDEAGSKLRHCPVRRVGMPVRPELTPGDAGEARSALGLDPSRPVLLVMGGSQGARAINEAAAAALENLITREPALQFIHLTGDSEHASILAHHRRLGTRAVVEPFHHQMCDVLRAATVAVGRAGASSIAECAALRIPSVLIPYPSAADDHQRLNALALERVGAAVMLDQGNLSATTLIGAVEKLLVPETRARMADALARWDTPNAAEAVATEILDQLGLHPALSETGVRRASSFGLQPTSTLISS